MSLTVHITGIGLLGPGLPSWRDGRALLADPSGWTSSATVVPPPLRLAANERRRAGLLVKSCLVVADEACAMAGVDVSRVPTVFTASGGDPVNCHVMCETLATPERAVSPTRFTNSVHNAPAGYWHIAAASTAASTSLSAFDDSFEAGLVEAMSQCAAAASPVLLVAADQPYPEPLNAKRPLPDLFAVALLLSPGAAAHGRPLSLREAAAGDQPMRCDDERLEALRRGIPAARALPLLQALARGSALRGLVASWPGRVIALGTADSANTIAPGAVHIAP